MDGDSEPDIGLQGRAPSESQVALAANSVNPEPVREALSDQETCYSAASQLRHPRQFAKAMLVDLAASRELAWQLLARNLRGQYREPFLGYLWILLPPLAVAGIWILLHRTGIFQTSGLSVPYPVYIVAGTLLWQCFVDALNSPLQQLKASEYMLTKIKFSREALLLAGMGEVTLNSAVRLLLLVVVLAFFGLRFPPTAFLAPFGVLAIVALGGAIGLLLAPLGLVYPDVERVLGILTLVWFFLAPIVYVVPPGAHAPFHPLLNPAGPLLITTREMITTGDFSMTGLFWAEVGMLFPLLVFGSVLFRLAMPHVIERLTAR